MGGGYSGYDESWIVSAIERAVTLYKDKNLDVRILHVQNFNHQKGGSGASSSINFNYNAYETLVDRFEQSQKSEEEGPSRAAESTALPPRIPPPRMKSDPVSHGRYSLSEYQRECDNMGFCTSHAESAEYWEKMCFEPPSFEDQFSNIMRFGESPGPSEDESWRETRHWLKTKLIVSESEKIQNQYLISRVTGKYFRVGVVRDVSVKNLKEEVLKDSKQGGSGQLNVWNVLREGGDRGESSLQVTSKGRNKFSTFFCTGANAWLDGCSRAFAPGLIYRKFFHYFDVDSHGKKVSKRGVKGSSNIEIAMDGVKGETLMKNNKYFTFATVTGGNEFSGERLKLEQLGKQLASGDPQKLANIRDKLVVGVHENVAFDATDDEQVQKSGPLPSQTQVFGIAPKFKSVSSGPINDIAPWAPLALFFLEAGYEAALLAAVKSSNKHNDSYSNQKGGSGTDSGSTLVFLPGAVANYPSEWVSTALERALERYKGYKLDVRIIWTREYLYGSSKGNGPDSTSSSKVYPHRECHAAIPEGFRKLQEKYKPPAGADRGTQEGEPPSKEVWQRWEENELNLINQGG